jgi:hypothetical protein
VIGGDTYVRGAAIDHLQYGIEHSDDRAIWAIFSFGESTQAVEMAKELVRPIDKLNDHQALRGIRLEEPAAESRSFIAVGFNSLIATFPFGVRISFDWRSAPPR